MSNILSLRNVGIIFAAAAVMIAGAFVVAAVHAAPQKAFWDDERYDLSMIGADSYGKMIVGGSSGQLTHSPLHFLFFRFMYDHKDVGKALGLPDTLYFRLFTIFFALVSGLVVAFAAFMRFKKETADPRVLLGQGLLLLTLLLVYYFHPYLFRFAIETRPYCLWYSLWFVSLSLLMIRGDLQWWMVLLLVALAATTTIAVFQIFSLAAAFFFVHWAYERWDARAVRALAVKTVKFFIVPAVVIFFYLRQDAYVLSYSQTLALAGFCQYWMSSFLVPALAVVGLYMVWGKKEYRGSAIVMLAILILFLLGPLSCYVTLKRHLYFEARHYIYNRLVYPLFLLHLAVFLPRFLQDKVNLWSKAKIRAYIIFACCFIPLYSLQYIFAEYGAIKTVRLNQSIPMDYHDLVVSTEEGRKLSRQQIQPYLDYYDNLVRYMPALPEGHALQAFCYYQLGQVQQAIRGYQKAAELAPGFYWYHFNLAAIYFNAGQYEKALESLERSRGCDMGKTMAFIVGSTRVYLPIRLEYLKNYQRPIERQMMEGRLQAQRMLVLSRFHLRQYAPAALLGQQAIASMGDPDGFLTYYVGRAFFELRSYDLALDCFLKVLKMAPECIEAHRYLSEILKLSGREAEAQAVHKTYEALKKTKPSLPWEEKQFPLQIY